MHAPDSGNAASMAAARTPSIVLLALLPLLPPINELDVYVEEIVWLRDITLKIMGFRLDLLAPIRTWKKVIELPNYKVVIMDFIV